MPERAYPPLRAGGAPARDRPRARPGSAGGHDCSSSWRSASGCPPRRASRPCRGRQRGRAGGESLDDPAVLDADVPDFAVDPVRRIVDGAAHDPKPLRCAHPVRPVAPHPHAREQCGQDVGAPPAAGRAAAAAAAAPRPSGRRSRLRECRRRRCRSRRGSETAPRWRADRSPPIGTARPPSERLASARRCLPPGRRNGRRLPCKPPSPRSRRRVTRVSCSKLDRHRVSGLPGQHRLGPRAVAAGPERAERRAGRAVERLRERDQPFRSEGSRGTSVGSAS